MILTHLIFLNLLGGGSSTTVPEPVVISQGGGAVIVDEPKRKRKRAKVAEESEEKPREISEEEAQGMAAMYGSPMNANRPEAAPEAINPLIDSLIEPEPEVIAPPGILEPFSIPSSVYGPEEVEIAEEVDDIALILAIIEAIG